MTIDQIIDTYAKRAGLNNSIDPFVKGDDLASAFAEAPYLMAPMAGVSDGAYRIMARLGGASLAYSEMVSVAGLHYDSDKTWELVLPKEGEPDIAVQLFGTKLDQFKEAVVDIQNRLGDQLVLFDINMACPVPKVVKKGEGSALLENPDLAAQIVQACVSVSDVPVTVKMRVARHFPNVVGPEFARVVESAGASAVAVHGRSASQMYSGESDIELVRQVVDAVSIPAIATGDMLNAQIVSDTHKSLNCAGVMCARGTYGNPWIFSDAKIIDAGGVAPEHSVEQRLNAFMMHVRLLEATGAHLKRARSLAGWYLKGVKGAAHMRELASHMEIADEFCSLAESVLESL